MTRVLFFDVRTPDAVDKIVGCRDHIPQLRGDNTYTAGYDAGGVRETIGLGTRPFGDTHWCQ